MLLLHLKVEKYFGNMMIYVRRLHEPSELKDCSDDDVSDDDEDSDVMDTAA